MIRFLLTLIIVICFNNVYAITISEILKNVKAKEKETESMQADIIENIYSEETKITQTFEGKIILKKPDKIYVEFTKPLTQKIISDGKFIWIYIPELNQAIKQEVSLGDIDDPILAIGKLFETLQKDYDIVLAGDENVDGEDTYLLDFTPKKGNENLPKMKASISKKSWIPVKSDIIEKQHLVNISIIFKNIKTNIKISNSIFEFTPPKDVEIITSPVQITPK